MNDYRRFVSYIYNYEMKIKKNNVGFARVETKENQCKITIHMQVKSFSNGSINLYGFARDEVDFVAIPLGEVTFKNGNGDAQILTNLDHLGDSSLGFEKIGGLILYLADDKYFGTEWDDKPLVFKEFHLLEEVEEKEELGVEAAEIKVEENEFERIAKNIIDNHADEIELFQVNSFFSPYTLTDLLERFTYAVTDNFMLHGYYRFGHLGVMQKNNRFVLGVPGIFCKREEMIASRSGFHNFYPKNGGNLQYGDFGYWYTSIEYLK